jgi:hypothetical protein
MMKKSPRRFTETMTRYLARASRAVIRPRRKSSRKQPPLRDPGALSLANLVVNM